MKRLLILVMVLALAVGFAACRGGNVPQTNPDQTDPSTIVDTNPTEESTVPTTQPVSDSVVGGIDLTGLTMEQAAQALNDAAASYLLTMNVNGSELTVSAADLELVLDEAALGAFLDALRTDAELPEGVFTHNSEVLRNILTEQLNVAPENASISYDDNQKKFVIIEGADGTEYDMAAVEAGAAAAIGLLKSSAEITVDTTKVAPELTGDSEKVQAALAKANGYLQVDLTYTYAPDGGQTAKEKLDAASIASFVSVSEDMTVEISKSAIESYVARMAERHNGADYTDKFKTTGGGTISSVVTYYGQKLNSSALTNDIYKCLTELQSGNRTAPYRAKSEKPYGGSYVEINLSSQKLWLYKDGECLLSTNLVSGSVAKEYFTPTGVYSIYHKKTDCYLTGADYRSFVSYWMPFLGGYGLHDATWRGSFGGDIYLYNGSHGCVNLPFSAAKTIYNNVSVGTKVILYGGKREVPDLEQKLTGTMSYEVTMDSAPFKLDVKAKYSDAKLNYASSDTRVVKVSSDGKVTVVGEGTAVITVEAAPFEYYTGAELKITIKVNPTAVTEPTDPAPTDPAPTDPAPTDPAPTDPAPTDPAPTDPAPTDPAPTDPAPTDPAPTDPAPTDPAPTDPAPTDPVPTDPAPTDPVPTDPAPTDPAPTDPAPTDSVPTDPAE